MSARVWPVSDSPRAGTLTSPNRVTLEVELSLAHRYIKALSSDLKRTGAPMLMALTASWLTTRVREFAHEYQHSKY